MPDRSHLLQIKSRLCRWRRYVAQATLCALLTLTMSVHAQPSAPAADSSGLGAKLESQLFALESNRPPTEDLGHLQEASEVLAAAETLGDYSLIARAELAISRHLNARALWDQEQAHAQAALVAATEAVDVGSQLRAKLMLAGLLVRRGQLAPAQELLLDILQTARAQQQHWVQTRALLSLSSAAGRSGDFEAAREFVVRGLAIAQRERFNELRVRLLINRTHILDLNGEFAQAEVALQQALEIEIEPPSTELSQTLVLVQLSMMDNQPEARLSLAAGLVAEARESGNRHLLAFALAAQGRAQCALRANEFGAELFVEAAEVYLQLDLPSERTTTLQEGAQCFAAIQRHKRAYELSALAQTSEQVAVERRRSEVAASLNVAYQSEQRQRELVHAELAAERLRAEVAAQQRDRLLWIALALAAVGVAAWGWARSRSRLARLRVVEAAQRERIDLLALTSHEIRNPAHGLVSALRVLRERANDPETAKLLSSAGHAADLIARLSTDALDLSLIEQGRLSINLGPVDLADVLNEMAQLEQPAATDKGLSVRTEVSGARGTVAMLDRQRISQVLLNLIGNAIRYSSSGEVVLRSWIEDDTGAERWLVEVSDCGPGLNDDELERVFEPYFRGSASGRSVGGGLGLTVTRRIIEAHGGSIQVRNGEVGAVFGFSLPLVAAFGSANETGTDKVEVRLPGYRLLIIDDDEFVRMGARLIAESVGIKVHDIADAEHLHEQLRAFGPDAVLCDRHLGDDDGMELLASVRSLHPGAKPKLILMTGDDTLPAAAAPLDGVLGKPFSIEQLVGLLR